VNLGTMGLLTEPECVARACWPQVVCDYGNNGQMKKLGISWFPPVHEQIRHFIKNGEGRMTFTHTETRVPTHTTDTETQVPTHTTRLNTDKGHRAHK
jgi:hypothetical protein